MFKKMLKVGIFASMVLTLGGCGDAESSIKEKAGVDSSVVDSIDTASVIPESESNSEKADVGSDFAILIAYFSWSGNTEQFAGMIQEQVGGDLLEIKPKTPYTDDINKLSGISLQEQQDNFRPELSSVVEDMEQYDVVFIGFPNMEQGFNSVSCA